MLHRNCALVVFILTLTLALACDDGNAESSRVTPTVAEPTRATGQTTTTPARTTTSPTHTATTAPASGAAAELSSAFDNLAKQRSFRARISLDAGTLGKYEGTMESLLPDKVRFAVTGGAGPLAGLEFITIGGDSYTKVAGKWTKGASSSGSLFNPQDIADGLKEGIATTPVTKGGTETVNGKRCQVYTAKDTDGTTTSFCVADNLPHRMTLTATNGSFTILLSDFNSNITIRPPI